MRFSASLVLGLVIVSFASSTHALEASCGLVVPAGSIAVLTSDLNCTDTPIAIALEANATLDLQGFTLTVGSGFGVLCRHRACTVMSSATGPGVLEGTGFGSFGVWPNGLFDDHPPIRKMVVDNLVLRNFQNGVGGVPWAKTFLSRLTISGCVGSGIVGGNLVLLDVTVTGSGGVLDPDGGEGIVAMKIRGENVVVTDNTDDGIFAFKSVTLRGLTATGNGNDGVDARQVKLADSVVTGNLVDIRSYRRPRLKETRCDRSNWGVCALD